MEDRVTQKQKLQALHAELLQQLDSLNHLANTVIIEALRCSAQIGVTEHLLKALNIHEVPKGPVQ